MKFAVIPTERSDEGSTIVFSKINKVDPSASVRDDTDKGKFIQTKRLFEFPTDGILKSFLFMFLPGMRRIAVSM